MILAHAEAARSIKIATEQINFFTLYCPKPGQYLFLTVMRAFILFLTMFISGASFAQEDSTLIYHIDPKLEKIIEQRNALLKENPVLAGYRVQIYFGSNRIEAQEARSKFASLYPDIDTYLIYQQPYFKLRAGDFRTRLEAYKLFQNIQKEFKSVFIVNDEINLPKL